MLSFYKVQKVSRIGAVGISLQKSRFPEQRKTCFVANVAAPYCELQITLLEASFYLLAAETMIAFLGGFSNTSSKPLRRYGVVSRWLALGRIIRNFAGPARLPKWACVDTEST